MERVIPPSTLVWANSTRQELYPRLELRCHSSAPFYGRPNVSFPDRSFLIPDRSLMHNKKNACSRGGVVSGWGDADVSIVSPHRDNYRMFTPLSHPTPLQRYKHFHENFTTREQLVSHNVPLTPHKLLIYTPIRHTKKFCTPNRHHGSTFTFLYYLCIGTGSLWNAYLLGF
jgi:hypothetical protein